MAIAASAPPGEPADPQSTGEPAVPLLQNWDKQQFELRQFIWRSYAATAALGKDSRDRTIADDLNEWVMTKTVQDRLAGLRAQVDRLIQKNDTARARQLVETGEAEIRAQQQLAADIGFYWQSVLEIRRQRDLWSPWLLRAPDADAARSRTLIAARETAPVRDFPRTASHADIENWARPLKRAYNEERQRLAASVSEHALAAGQVMATRQQSALCATAPVASANQKSARTAASGDQPVRVVTDMATDRFYPQDARRTGVSGSVEVRLSVSASGCVERVDVLRSSGADELDQAAMDWSNYIQFLPAMHGHQPVPGTYASTVVFGGSDGAPALVDSCLSPSTVALHIMCGNHWLEQRQYDRSIDQLNKAIALDSTNAMAFADRGLAHFWMHQFDAARRDFDAAGQLDPRNAVALRGRALLALESNDLAAAIAAFTASLEVDARNTFALAWRARIYLRMGEKDKALADYAASIAVNPNLLNSYGARASIFRSQAQPALSIAEADALIAQNPHDAAAYRMAAEIYTASGKPDEATRFIDHAIEIAANEQNYLTRAEYRHGKDPVGERSDLEAALAAKPNAPGSSAMLAKLQLDAGDVSGAHETLRKALSAYPDDPGLLTAQGIAYLKDGHADLAEPQLIKARAAAKTAQQLNSLCWALATSDVALGKALQACDAALAMAPDISSHAIHDSRGFVLLRLGRYDEAIASYDASLRIDPLVAASLYGRGIARKRKGQGDGAEADIRAALLSDADISAEFSGYGVAP
jgi:TonB family protein